MPEPMDLKTALSHARTYVAKIVRPFEQIEAVLQAALEAESRVGGLDRQAAALQATITELQGKIPPLQTAIADLTEKRLQAIAAAAEEQNRIAREFDTKQRDYLRQVDQLQGDLLEKELAAQGRLERLTNEEAVAAKRIADLKARFAALREEIPA